MRFSRELFLCVSHFPPWIAGAALAAGIAWLARRVGALSSSGAVAATVIGTVAVGAGWSWALILIVYFVSASALSRFRAADKDARTAGRVEKGGARDAAQVAANGGVFAIAALLHWSGAHPTWQMAGAAALAASAADTWATELGTLARSAPRSILGGRVVPAGTSGGVTVQGFTAGIAGAALIAGTVALARWPAAAVTSALAGGILGCVLDSLLGAAVQARRWCPACRADTERRVHQCATVTEVRGGFAWLDNDGVNAASTLGGALLGTLAGYLAAA